MRGHTIFGVIVILIGLSILLHFAFFNFLFALIIIWIGVRILTGHRYDPWGMETEASEGEDFLSRVFIFSGLRKKMTSDNFEGMNVAVIFGGGEIDLTGVKTQKTDLDLEINAVFGGLKLKIPKTWKIKSDAVGILGGFNNMTASPEKPAATVHLKGSAIFGGIEIVN